MRLLRVLVLVVLGNAAGVLSMPGGLRRLAAEQREAQPSPTGGRAWRLKAVGGSGAWDIKRLNFITADGETLGLDHCTPLSSGSAYGSQNAFEAGGADDWGSEGIWGGRADVHGNLFLGLTCSAPHALTSLEIQQNSPGNNRARVALERHDSFGPGASWTQVEEVALNTSTKLMQKHALTQTSPSSGWRLRSISGSGPWDVKSLNFVTADGQTLGLQECQPESSGSAYGPQNPFSTAPSGGWGYASIWGGRKDIHGDLYLGLVCDQARTVTALEISQSPINSRREVVLEQSATGNFNASWEVVASLALSTDSTGMQTLKLQGASAEPTSSSMPWTTMKVVCVIVPAVVCILVSSLAVRWLLRAYRQMTWDPQAPIEPALAREIQLLKQRCKTLDDEITKPSPAHVSCCWSVQQAHLVAKARQLRERADVLLAKAALIAGNGPQNWSVSVEQLAAFHATHSSDLQRYCENHWLSPGLEHVCLQQPCPHSHGDARHGCALPSDADKPSMSLNMHIVVDVLIKPLTNSFEGILGLWSLMNSGAAQKATTFVSHCWNECFDDFVRTLCVLQPQTRVWICSFALPQNIDIGKVLGKSPSQSPFAVALSHADRVLLAVDSHVEPLTRSWCCFELFLAVSHKMRIDIRAPVQSVQLYGDIKDRIATVDIRKCKASNPDDHTVIMNELQGQEELVNQKLRENAGETLQFLTHVVQSSILPCDKSLGDSTSFPL